MLTSVPRVVAVRPGQFRPEAVDQIEECPCQDDYVVNAAVQDNHLTSIAETCANIRGERTRYQGANVHFNPNDLTSFTIKTVSMNFTQRLIPKQATVPRKQTPFKTDRNCWDQARAGPPADGWPGKAGGEGEIKQT